MIQWIIEVARQVLRGPGEYALNNNETGPLGKATWFKYWNIFDADFRG